MPIPIPIIYFAYSCIYLLITEKHPLLYDSLITHIPFKELVQHDNGILVFNDLKVPFPIKSLGPLIPQHSN